MADEAPGIETGDVVIVVVEKPDEVFQRKGNELIMNMKIGLNEALTGFTRPVTTLDGRTIAITSCPGEFVIHESLKVVTSEGMPIHRNPFEKGNLVIKFEVQYPPKAWFTNEENIKKLNAILPKKSEQAVVDDDTEEVILEDFDAANHGNKSRKGHSAAYDEDDSDEGMGGHSHGGPGGVQCQTQ